MECRLDNIDFSKDDWMINFVPGAGIHKYSREIFKVEEQFLGEGSFANVYRAKTKEIKTGN